MNVTITATVEGLTRAASPMTGIVTFVRRNPTIAFGALLLALLLAMAIAAPLIAGDPFRQAPINRLRFT